MRLSGYRFGRIEVDGEEWTRDVAVLPDGAKPWIRKEGHRVHPEDLREVLAASPQMVIIGTGYSGVLKVTPEAEEFMRQKGIELLTLKTAEAVEAFSELSPKRKVCALLHLTC